MHDYAQLISADEHIIRHTGKSIREWIKILHTLHSQRSNNRDVVVFLQSMFSLPAYKALALNTYYLGQKKRNEMKIRFNGL